MYIINNKTTRVRVKSTGVKSTGGKTYLSKKYLKYKVKVKVLLSIACRGGGGGTSPMD